MGGRVAENVGFLLEGQMIAAAPLAAGFKMPFVFDVGAAKLSVIPFTTDALSVQYGYEQSSGGVMRANRWAEHRRELPLSSTTLTVVLTVVAQLVLRS